MLFFLFLSSGIFFEKFSKSVLPEHLFAYSPISRIASII